jgi:hypothetical protein
MNDTNREHPERDVLDEIDEAVSQITDDDIEDRLRDILRRAGHTPRQRTSAAGTITETDLARLLL